MEERKVYATPKIPLLPEATARVHGYEFSSHQWNLIEFHDSHGGDPEIAGVFTVGKLEPCYKLIYPDKFVTHIALKDFDTHYQMKL